MLGTASPPTCTDLLTDLGRNFTARCGEQLALAMRRVDEDLFDEAEAANDNRRQAALFEGMRAFRRNAASVRRRFEDELRTGFRAVGSPAGDASLRPGPDLQRTLALSELALRLELGCRPRLAALRRRLAALANRDELPSEVDPIAPARIAACVDRAVDAAGAPPAAVEAFVRRIERDLFAKLEASYSDLNLQLARAGILPDIDPPLPPPADWPVVREVGPPPPTAGPDRDRPLAWVEQLIILIGESWPASDAALGATTIQAGGGPLEAEEIIRRRRHVGALLDGLAAHLELPMPARTVVDRLRLPLLRRALRDPTGVSRGSHGARVLLTRFTRRIAAGISDDHLATAIFGKMQPWIGRLAGQLGEPPAPFTSLMQELEELAHGMDQSVDENAQQAPQQPGRVAEARSVADAEVDRRLGRQELPGVVADLIGTAWNNVLVLTLLRNGEGSEQWTEALACLDDLVWTATPKASAADVARLQSMLPQLSRQLRGGLEMVAFTESEVDEVFDALRELYRSEIAEPYRDKLHMPTARGSRPLQSAERLRPTMLRPVPIEAGAGDGGSAPEPVRRGANSYVRARIESLRNGAWLEFRAPDGDRIRAKLSWVSPISKNYLFVTEAGTKLADKSLDELTDEVVRGETLLLDASPVFRSPGRS